MGRVYDGIDDRLANFIKRQHMFFVGTAPTDPDGRLNLSPKGLDTFRVLGPRRVAYLELTGSGVETIAHLRDNGRMTVMFCSFDARPVVLRLHGRGRVVEPTDADWAELSPHFPDLPGARAVIVLDVDRVSDSCGLGVPIYEHRGDRSGLIDFAHKSGPDGLADYRRRKNAASIDGLPGLSPPGLSADA